MTLALILLCLLCVVHSVTEANSTHSPRMIFTDKETIVKRIALPEHDAVVQILLNGQSDTVIAATPTHLNSYHFHTTPQKPKVLWNCSYGSSSEVCSYNLNVVLKMEEANRWFMCGTNNVSPTHSLCCEADFSSQLPSCMTTDKLRGIDESIKSFQINEGESSVLDETGDSADLYITHSGSQRNVGIHKFGKKNVRPSTQGKEQHYVDMILSRRRNDSLQNRVYAFYKEKHQDPNLFSGMWLPYVTQVCMSDLGGSKQTLQNRWTSQMNAKLFCGDVNTKQHFSELVDVTIVHDADKWQDTRVYGLFRNEWGMSALCVFTVQDIDRVFATSQFKGADMVTARTRQCVANSNSLSPLALSLIVQHSEMEQSVQPVNNSGPLFSNHHNYTHIYADSSGQHTVIFLSLNNGRIHKVIQTKNQTLIIAEYCPFTHRAHIHSIIFQPSSRKLYVYAGSELVQLDVGNCAMYGDSCQQCLLARDPYCGWDGARCSPRMNDSQQVLITGDYTKCPVKPHSDAVTGEAANKITLPAKSRHFLQCPVLSHHALYSWHHHKSSTPCLSKGPDCVLLIDNMSPEKVGDYRCVSEELGHVQVQALYHLRLKNRAAAPSLSPLLWGCLTTALIACLSSCS